MSKSGLRQPGRRTETATPEIAALQALRPVPRISIQAFCETEGVARPIERAGEDRRMAKAHLKVHRAASPPRNEFYRRRRRRT